MNICCVTKGRTGSEMLTRFIFNHPDFVGMSEPFNWHQKTSWRQDFVVQLYADFLEVPRDNLPDEPLYLHAIKNPQFLEFIYQTVDYCKLLYDHFTPSIENWVKKNCTVIHLTRNSLHNYVSFLVAKKTLTWHTWDDQQPDLTTTVHVDLASLEDQIQRDARNHENWKDAYQITYEELTSDWEKTTHNLQKYLGIKTPISVSHPLKKTIARPLEEVIENYNEIRDSKYGVYL